MKITDVRTIGVECRLPQPVYDANYEMATKAALLVEVVTDEGLVGLGEAAHFGGPLASTRVVIEGELRAYLLGENPLDVERLWERMHQRAYKHGRGGIVIAAISGVDIALWDLRGKVAGLPVWRLLGGYRDRVPAYASGGFYAEGKDLAALRDEVTMFRARGFRAVKMKVGRSPAIPSNPLRVMSHRDVCATTPAEDLERVRAVREAIGPDCQLMVDANGAWDVPLAVAMARRLEPLDIFWLEEPVSPDDVEGSARVAGATVIPIAGYETCSYGRYSFKDYIVRGAVHFVQPDVAWSGGFTECLKIAHLAEAWHLPVAPHIHASAVGVAAGLHLLGGIPNGSLAEMIFPEQPLMTDLVTEPLRVDARGEVALPDRPGLGLTLVPGEVERYRVPG